MSTKDSDTTPRFLWSVVIPAHNCAELLRPCLQSVIGQLGNRSDAEIVVVDDGSSDHPELVVDEVAGTRVRVVRNESALGAVPNFNKCIGEASGSLIHILHGDDLVQPGFYEAQEAALNSDAVVMAFCRTQQIDDVGNPIALTRRYLPGGGVWAEASDYLASSNRIATPSVVLKARTYQEVGGFDETLPHAADWDMWARAAASGPVYFIDRVLAQYRIHGQNDTSKRVKTGANMSERYQALEHVLTYAPEQQHRGLRRRAAALGAAYAARQTVRQLKKREFKTAGVQAGWVLESLKRTVLPGDNDG